MVDMAVPLSHGGKVTVTLRPLHSSSERKFILDRTKSTVQIGRSNNREFPEAEDNAYFLCRVMSREHAELSADFSAKKLLIKDLSLHGTYVGGIKLAKGVLVPISSGDLITFGLETVREGETFPPLAVYIDAKWDVNTTATETATPLEPSCLNLPGPVSWATAKDIFGDEIPQINSAASLADLGNTLDSPQSAKIPVTIDLTTNEQEISNPHQKSVSNFFDDMLDALNAEVVHESSDSEDSDGGSLYVSPVRRSSESSNHLVESSPANAKAAIYDPDKTLYTDSESEDDANFDVDDLNAHDSDMSDASSHDSYEEFDASGDEEMSEDEVDRMSNVDSSEAESNDDSDAPLAQAVRPTSSVPAKLHPTPITVEEDLMDSDYAASSISEEPSDYNTDYDSHSSDVEAGDIKLDSGVQDDLSVDEQSDDDLDLRDEELEEEEIPLLLQEAKLGSSIQVLLNNDDEEPLEYDSDYNSDSSEEDPEEEDFASLLKEAKLALEAPVLPPVHEVKHATEPIPENTTTTTILETRKTATTARPPSPSDAAMVKPISTSSRSPRLSQFFDAVRADCATAISQTNAEHTMGRPTFDSILQNLPQLSWSNRSFAQNDQSARQPIASSLLDRDGVRSILNDDFSLAQDPVRPLATPFSRVKPNTRSTQQDRPAKKMSIQELVEPQENDTASSSFGMKRKADKLSEDPSQRSSTGLGESTLQDAQVYPTFPIPVFPASQAETHAKFGIATVEAGPSLFGEVTEHDLISTPNVPSFGEKMELSTASDATSVSNKADAEPISPPASKRARTEKKLDNTPKTAGIKREAVNMSRTRYAAHALGWAAIGAVGVVTTLISLPADYFA